MTAIISDGPEAHDRLLTGWMDNDGRVHVVLPIPPGVLGHHGDGWIISGSTRSGRRYRVTQATTAFREHKQMALRCIQQATSCDRWYWPDVRMDVRWYFSGPLADDDGIWQRCSAYRDAAQAAGLVADDRFVRQGTLTLYRVRRRYQCVEIVFRRADV